MEDAAKKETDHLTAAMLSGQLPTPRPYVIEDGKIQAEACELNVCDHCNVNCRWCSHLSNRLKVSFMEPSEVRRDLSALSEVYRVDHVRLVGGEPLLHPRLLELIEAIRQSGVTDTIRLVTNGVLLAKAPQALWSSVDEIHLSMYPSRTLTAEAVTELQDRARESGVELLVKHYDSFRMSYSDSGTQDSELIRAIYATCQVAHVWRCHTVDRGFFYRCPQSLFIPKAVPGVTWSVDSDRLPIRGGDGFREELLDFLQREEPLAACSKCLGSVGRIFPHTIGGRGDSHPEPSEALLDPVHLRTLIEDPSAPHRCTREGGRYGEPGQESRWYRKMQRPHSTK